MTSEPLGTLTDMVIAVIIMFIFPTVCCLNLWEQLEYDNLMKSAQSFTEDICSFGYIDEERYKAYLSRVAAVSAGAGTEMKLESREYEPVYENGYFTGRVTEYIAVRSNEEITEKIFDKGRFRIDAGDRIVIEIMTTEGRFIRCEGKIGGRAAIAEDSR